MSLVAATNARRPAYNRPRVPGMMRRQPMPMRDPICALVLATILGGCDFQARSERGGDGLAAASPAAMVRSVRSADGAEIAFSVAGRGETALVFIHGWSCDSTYWDAQAPAFSGAYTTVTVDLAGHGGSSATRRNWSMAAYGHDVAAVIRSLPHRRIVLVGHSMGGYVALEAARLVPERVIGVIGVDSLQDLDGQETDKQGAEALLANLRHDPQQTTRSFVLESFFTERSEPALARRIADDMASAPPSVSVPSMETLIRYDPKPAGSALQIPVVAIVGEMMPVNETAARRLVPGFRARKISGAGHFLHIEDPATFNATLAAEVARIEAGPGRPERTGETRPRGPVSSGATTPAMAAS